MRPRTKITNICSHAKPTGKAYMGRKDVLKRKFERGDITTEELREYSSFLAVARTKPQTNPTWVFVTVWGKRQRVTWTEYVNIYKPQGFKYTT